eukprot:9033094-Pyramimonas_sp.AAC.1
MVNGGTSPWDAGGGGDGAIGRSVQLLVEIGKYIRNISSGRFFDTIRISHPRDQLCLRAAWSALGVCRLVWISRERYASRVLLDGVGLPSAWDIVALSLRRGSLQLEPVAVSIITSSMYSQRSSGNSG